MATNEMNYIYFFKSKVIIPPNIELGIDIQAIIVNIVNVGANKYGFVLMCLPVSTAITDDHIF
jgi:hypothetical protein